MDDPVRELDHARHHFFLPARFDDPFGNVSTVGYDNHDLMVVEARDPLGNTIHAVIDYRVLSPFLMTDANGNRSQVAYDSLGMVVGTAVMGKEYEGLGDTLKDFVPDLAERTILEHIRQPLRDPREILQGASTRLVYDLFAYERTRGHSQTEAVVVYTMARETHVSDLGPAQKTRIQHSFSYSDGFGREIQKKIQAEPGPLVEGGPEVDPRWVGAGWTIFNNKGKPVRQYEPFFSSTEEFEFARIVGVSPVLFYDPVERVVATLHPNHTFEKVVFDPWYQQRWDVNDTVLQRHPTTDCDVGGFFQRLPSNDFFPSWYSLRTDPAYAAAAALLWPDPTIRAKETEAAVKAAAHAFTPAIAYSDSLGRSFLTIDDNASAGKFAMRVELDIEGNQRSVTDALGRKVMVYDFDLRQNRIQQSSMEAGDRWTLNDVIGKQVRSWDSRGHNFRTEYDGLRRPTAMFVEGTDPVNSDPRTTAAEVHFQKIEYGEGQPEFLNLRTRVFRTSDTAGVVTYMAKDPATGQDEAYDFKGNLLRSARQFVTDYKALPDWGTTPVLETEIFTSSTQYDALNRAITATTPDGSVVRPTYNEANFTESVSVNLQGAAAATAFVTNIDYDAKGQRVLVEYGNNTQTKYAYDLQTFRLTQLTTTRLEFPQNQQVVQDLFYTYDPAGNITHIQDDADTHNAVFFRNRRVEPSNDYTYDAIYRLIQASGREQLGLGAGHRALPPTASSYNDVPRVGLSPVPTDGNAVGLYYEQYRYDAAGNFLHLIHKGPNPTAPGWTRTYSYNEASLLEPGKVSNRLSRTTVSGNWPLNEPYTHDLHGNMTSMPQLQAMQWNFKDELLMTQRQAVNASDADGVLYQAERTYYVHDSTGQRARKVTESAAGITKKARFYIGGFEVYREYDAGGTITLERETLHVMDDKKRIAIVETRTRGTDPSSAQLMRYQFSNHLGSACLELDDAAQIISYEEYCPYGNTSYQAGRSAVEVALKRYRYTGKERDEETGFDYHGRRFYALWLAKWTSPDPQGLSGNVNLYTYCLCNPIINVDPSGLENIVVVGSQYQEKSGNKLMFAHQGISKVKDYRENEKSERTTFAIFREGYTQGQLDAIAKEVKAMGGGFVILDSANDLISYVNKGLLTSEAGAPNRAADKVSNLDFFSHGVVGAVEFGYKTSKADEYRLNKDNVSKFDSKAFGKDNSPEREDNITSYACRTALGTFDYDQTHQTFEQSMGWDPQQYRYDFKVRESLAQKLANATNTDVVGYYVKTEYSDTLGSEQDRRDSCAWYSIGSHGCSQTPELKASMSRRQDLSGATFDPHGAMHPVRKGDMPTGLENQTGAVLIHPQSMKLPITPYTPRVIR
jgi:RHS repeat-associated protein